MKANERIKGAMRRNEVELMAHLRAYRVIGTSFFGRSWHNALERLMNAKRVVYRDGRYAVRKGAQPVTGAAR